MNEKEFVEDIKIEMENLGRVNEEMKNLLTKIVEEPTFIEIRAAASILDDFYSGAEKVFERIAVSIDKTLPKGRSWHRELLLQMARPYPDARESVISEILCKKLNEYRKFRHLLRHTYGFKLSWERFRDLCLNLEDILSELKIELERFLKEFRENV